MFIGLVFVNCFGIISSAGVAIAGELIVACDDLIRVIVTGICESVAATATAAVIGVVGNVDGIGINFSVVDFTSCRYKCPVKRNDDKDECKSDVLLEEHLPVIGPTHDSM